MHALVQVVSPIAGDVSFSIHGTRAVQTLVDTVCGKPQLENLLLHLIQHLRSQVLDLTMDIHGNHVIQSFLCMTKENEASIKLTQWIYDCCMQHCVEIGSHKHGCCVMQRCLEKGIFAQKLQLSDVIVKYLPSLIEDPFGNYLVQNVLKLNDADRNQLIFSEIAKDFIRLSQLKFSSNVIEKCLESNQKKELTELLLRGTNPQDDVNLVMNLGDMVKNLSLRLKLIVDKLIYH